MKLSLRLVVAMFGISMLVGSNSSAFSALRRMSNSQKQQVEQIKKMAHLQTKFVNLINTINDAGRIPTSQEKAELDYLVDQISSLDQQAGAFAKLLSRNFSQ